ncbi:MAG: DUF4221 family protein [Bacteroidota bacterium]|nr:DUF4221 family protein [Bacteroidota bacterium]
MRKLSLTLFVLLLIISCNQSNVELPHKKEIKLVVDGLSESLGHLLSFNLSTIKGEAFLYYVNTQDSSFVIYNINGEKEVFPLKKVLSKPLLEPHNQWCVVNHDTIFAISRPEHKVYQFNLQDQITDSFNLYKKKPTISLPYVFISYLGHKMQYKNQRLFIPVTAKATYDSIKNLFFKPSGLIIDIMNDSLSIYGRYSEKPFLNSLKYRNPYHFFCVNDSTVVFSYPETGILYQYNYKTGHYSATEHSSRHIDSISPVPDSAMSNFAFIKKYGKTEPRYLGLRYDSYNSLYYQTVKHRSKEIPDPDGLHKAKIPRARNSLMVFDENLNLMDEIMLDTIVAAGWFISTKDGLLFGEPRYEKRTDTLCLHLFETQLSR